jgi:hypothetical protein
MNRMTKRLISRSASVAILLVAGQLALGQSPNPAADSTKEEPARYAGRSGPAPPSGAVNVDADDPPPVLRNVPLLLSKERHDRLGIRLPSPHRLTAELVRAMATVANLNHVECRDNPTIDDDSLDLFAQLPHLTELDLTRTAVTDAGLKKLVAAAPYLSRLSLEGTAVTDAGLKHLAQAKRLRGLILTGTRVANEGVAQLADNERLEEIWLDRTAITDDVAQSLSKMRLEALSLRGTKISGKLFAGLGEQPRLTTIWADATPLSDGDLRQLARLKSLQVLSLMRTSVTEAGANKLAELPKLRECYLGDGKGLAEFVKTLRWSSIFHDPLPAFRAPSGIRPFDD